MDSRSTRRSGLVGVNSAVVRVADPPGIPSPLPETSKLEPGDATSPKREAHRSSAQGRQQKFIKQAVAIEQASAQEAGMLGYMSRVLVQATMPHRATSARQFRRTNGELTVAITALGRFPLPFGTYPRLLLVWLTTEAVRKNTREIVLGDSLSQFMQSLGLLTTGGKWGTIPRFKTATLSLFSAAFSCFRESHAGSAEQQHAKFLHISDEYNLWWIPTERDPDTLWCSTVTLTEPFFREIVDRPVPVDLRAIKALKQSPMALDLYCWLTYRTSYLKRPTMIPWASLQAQFGAGYSASPHGLRDFRQAFIRETRKVLAIYPRAQISAETKGLQLSPGRTHVARRESLHLPSE